MRGPVCLSPLAGTVIREIAKAAVFLASDLASYVTGITLPVGGGWTAH